MSRETLDLAASEVRFDPGSEAGIVSGYAALFGILVPGFNEMVTRGAFKRTLAEHRAAKTKPIMLWSHDPTQPVGLWTDLTEDDRGLKVSGQILDTTRRGKETRALFAAGAVSGLSIGFRARKDSFDKTGVRMISDVDLAEISLVAIPAQPGARASYRSAAHAAPLAAFVSAASRAAHTLRGSK